MIKNIKYHTDEEGVTSKLSYFVLRFPVKDISDCKILGDWQEERDSPEKKLSKKEYNSLNSLYKFSKIYGKINLIELNQFYRERVGLNEENKISYLNLSDLGLKSIPIQYLLNLNALEVLCLSNNNINYLPLQLEDFEHLEQLYCDNNKFKNLDNILFKMNSLKEVSFESNSLNETSLELLDKLKKEKGVHVYY